ncbi:DNA methyltransferase, partial [Acinetobacter baumannii]
RSERSESEYDLLTRNKRSVWQVSTKPYKGAHFATFPMDLIEPCVLAGSRVNDVVFDPFMGSGKTAAVALMHNRNALGRE